MNFYTVRVNGPQLVAFRAGVLVSPHPDFGCVLTDDYLSLRVDPRVSVIKDRVLNGFIDKTEVPPVIKPGFENDDRLIIHIMVDLPADHIPCGVMRRSLTHASILENPEHFNQESYMYSLDHGCLITLAIGDRRFRLICDSGKLSVIEDKGDSTVSTPPSAPVVQKKPGFLQRLFGRKGSSGKGKLPKRKIQYV